jgi:hypothetical protein
MKRNLVFGTILTLSLAVIIAIAAVVPALAHYNRKGCDESDSLTYYAYGGQVTIQLPEGVPPHPTTLLVASMHVEKRGDYPIRGPHDVFMVYLWVSALNSFLPVAAVSDHPDPAHHDLMKAIYIGTPLWIPGLMENYFVPDDEVLVTRKRGDVFFANLTEGVHVSLPFDMLVGSPLSALGDLSFDLPPMALEIRGIDSVYFEEGEGATLPSDWSMKSRVWRKPAWVRVWIQEWTGGSDAFRFAGVLGVHGSFTCTPPPE